MPMKLTGQTILPVPPEAVWRALNDPVVLEACLPGCKALKRIDDRHFESTVQIRVGPVAATFKSNVELSDIDPPRAYTIAGMGNAGAVGFAKVTARLQLEARDDATVLLYDADVEIGGKLMSVGSRLIQSAAGKNLDEFFAALKAHVEPRVEAPSGSGQALDAPFGSSPGDGHDDARITTGVPRSESIKAGTPSIVSRCSAARVWQVWLVGAGSGVVGLVAGFFIGHAV
jgi:hypothetical protein